MTIGRSIKAQTIEIKKQELPEMRNFPGRVRSKVSIVLAAKMPGYVKEVPVQIGDLVKKGDLLVLVDDTDVRSRVDALFSAEKAARAELEAVAAKFEYSKINFNRFTRLFKEESATKDEYDRARTEYLALKNQVAAINANINRIRSQLREAKNQLSYVKIKAPMDGWISSRNVDPGTYVNPGVPLISLDGKGSGFWFEADIDETLHSDVATGDMVTVSIPAAEMDIQAPLVHIQRSSQPATHTFTILADLDSADLKSGLFGRVFVKLGSYQAIVLPESAVISRSGIKGVYTVDDSDIVRWRIVKTGKKWRKSEKRLLPFFSGMARKGDQEIYVTILSGLWPGDRVVVTNLSRVREGIHLE